MLQRPTATMDWELAWQEWRGLRRAPKRLPLRFVRRPSSLPSRLALETVVLTWGYWMTRQVLRMQLRQHL